MINQVVPNTVQRTFSDFTQPQNGWYSRTDKIDDKKRGKTIVLAGLFVGFGILALMKGAIPKKAAKYLEKLKINLERKIEKGGKYTNFYKSSVKGINSFLEKSQSINNITSLKDILFQKLMFQAGFTKSIHKGITNFFNRISRKTVNSSYARTGKKMAELNEYISSLNDKILEKNSRNVNIRNSVDNIKNHISGVNESYNKGFGIQARTERLAQIEGATGDLFDYMWNASYHDIKNFQSKNMYQTFIAEAKMQPFKTQMAKDVTENKKLLVEELNKVLNEYKNILTENEYNRLDSRVKSFIKSLDGSIKKETVNYVDKARDLKLGSAPTDILSILGTVGAVGWYLEKSNDKDEKISASLKYGIPAIGAIATSLICTAKLIAGTKSLAIGLLSGWLMNNIGEIVDGMRKQYKLDISLQNKAKLSQI